MKRLLVGLLIAGSLFAQVFGPAKKVRRGTSDPATCNEAEIFYNETSNVLKVCTAANTWTEVGSGGGGALNANLNIDAPTTSDTNRYQFNFRSAVTIDRISCSTDTGTVSINLDMREIATPNTAGVDVLSGVLVCDNNTQSSCAAGCDVNTITGGSIAAHKPVNLQITATASSPTVVRIHVEAQ